MFEICQKCSEVNKNLLCFKNIYCDNKDKSLIIILNYFRDNYFKYEFNINLLLDSIKISQTDIDYLINKYFEIPPKKLLENLRMEKSLILFSQNITIMKASIESGYNHLNSFQKVFHRRLNDNPTNIKSILRRDNNENILFGYFKNLWFNK